MDNIDERICRSLKGDTSNDEERKLRAWRDADPRNEAYYTQMARLLETAAAVASPGERNVYTPTAADLIDLADAPDEPTAGGQTGAPGDGRARGPRGRPSRRWIPVLAATAAGLALAFGLYTQLDRPEPFQMGAAEFASGPNEVTTATLTDGTVVRLAPDSRLRVVPAEGRREVHLTGRAYLAVAHMPDRPFRVRTAQGEVMVLGTRFDVRATGDLRVVVVEGRVALSTERKRVEVDAGHMSMVSGGDVMEPVKVDVGPIVSWVGPFIAFQSTPLRDVARELEQEYGTRVVLADSALADLTITGWYIDRTFEEVVVLVCGVLGAHCSIENGTATIASRSPTTQNR